MIAYVNNTFLNEEKAVLHVGDLALQRGYAAFDFLRTKNGQPLFLDNYLNRFFNSAALLHLHPQHTKKQVKEIIEQLVEENRMQESGIRMIMTGGYSPDSYEPAPANLVILQQPIEMPSAEKFAAGVNVITHEYLRDLPAAKSTNYLMGIWLQKKIREQKAQDVLYHQNGLVSEFPRANVFIVTKEGTVATPAENILKGITRMKLLRLMPAELKIEERPVTIEEVKNAAEVFMTSTTKRLLPVCQVDDVVIGDGKAGRVAGLLNNLFLRLESEAIELP